LEIVGNGLRSITDETYKALKRSAYSTNIKERHDHSTAIVDSRGRLIAQAEMSFPTHLGSILDTTRLLLSKYGLDRCEDGDVFIANDPYVAGGTHLPDVNLIAPVFVEGRLLAFICTIAHHADMGGMSPGSMAGGMTEIYQEGLRIPLVKLFRRGELDEELLELILLNVRVPAERRGDYAAQIAACRLGVRRLKEMAEHYSPPVLETAFDEILGRTNARIRSAILAVPDGEYRFADVLDDDGMGTEDIPVSVGIAVRGDRIAFDFTGTGPQVRGNMNAVLNATQASVAYVLKAMLDPEIPNNQGVQDAIDITCPAGCIANAVFPAAVAARNHLCQRIVDVVIGALAQALPERAVAAANGSNTSITFAGTDPRTGEPYVYFETLGGGFGGRATKDGKDGVQVHITNTSNLPVEAIETEYPLRVEEYALVPNSGGAGRYRGGLGLRRVIRPVDHACAFNGVGERFRHRPWGLFGGEAGSTGRFVVVGDDGSQQSLPGKVLDRPLRPDQALVAETPGAGGYGSPHDRIRLAVDEDGRTGKFSAAFVDEHYGRLDGSVDF
jgi:N-methylhydantoinase B